MAPAYVEVEPDVQSKTLGMLLFLPLLVFVYTAVVAVAGLKGVMPSILAAVQGVIWYILIGVVVATGLVVGGAFFLTGNLSLMAKKEKKPKSRKNPRKVRKIPPLRRTLARNPLLSEYLQPFWKPQKGCFFFHKIYYYAQVMWAVKYLYQTYISQTLS